MLVQPYHQNDSNRLTGVRLNIKYLQIKPTIAFADAYIRETLHLDINNRSAA